MKRTGHPCGDGQSTTRSTASRATRTLAAARRAARRVGLYRAPSSAITTRSSSSPTCTTSRKTMPRPPLIALTAGVDVDLPSGRSYSTLGDAVRQGKVPRARSTPRCAVSSTIKFHAGLFEDPYADVAERGSDHQQRRSTRAGAQGRAALDRAAEERRRAAADPARGGPEAGDRRDRSECGGGAPRRLLRHTAQSPSRCSTACGRWPAIAPISSTRAGRGDHRERRLVGGRGRSWAIPQRTAS